jgi:hypothetical protein
LDPWSVWALRNIGKLLPLPGNETRFVDGPHRRLVTSQYKCLLILCDILNDAAVYNITYWHGVLFDATLFS